VGCYFVICLICTICEGQREEEEGGVLMMDEEDSDDVEPLLKG
jgi:hypothetical protein